MANQDTVVVGATRRDLLVKIRNFDGTVPDVTGWTCRLQATSTDLPGVTIDQAGAVFGTVTLGQLKWTGIGAYVTTGNMAGKASAAFVCEIKVTDAVAKIDYSTPRFTLTYVLPVV